MLKIYNSLSRQKEPFQSIEPGKVSLYVCGMTVYDYCHVGHARVMVVFDSVVRYLRHRGYQVTYVRNITDIDDKIIRRAQDNGETVGALTGRFIVEMHRDADALGVLRPDLEPRAMAAMPQIISMIRMLIAKGFAYQAGNGDVYYDVSTFPAYGRLSGKQLDDLRAGERVAVDESKDDPLDFVLWKMAKPGEPQWESPWGPGRPGWHIECSVMSTQCLGDHFDIHGGGMDLMFPHHENEIAQSEAATGCRFVNVWMHNGFVNIDNEKMSKSLGNFFTVRDVLQRYHPEVVRYFILSSHYRSPLNYSDQSLENAKAALDRLYRTLRDYSDVEADLVQDEYLAKFQDAMDDDFNTPVAIAVLFDLARDINRLRDNDPRMAIRLVRQLKALAGVLGILTCDVEEYLQGGPGVTISGKVAVTSEDDSVVATGIVGLSVEDVHALIEQRLAARVAKNWAEADRIRQQLDAQGVVLEDKPNGKTEWRRK
ncbi:MAG: cysteine--tRNA ligase [Gammaproteobacteria bacterium]|nr:cysteine--tRNA ligase [Gammaproteobacteria bacterium]